MANLTVAIDDELIRRARLKAVSRGTSLNAVVRTLLAAYAGRSDAADTLDELFAIADRSGFTVGEAGITWSRGELHERADLR
jgi:hypothetical protein